MSDIQILTIAIALSTSFLAVFIGVFLNNNRLNDLKDVVSSKVEASGASLRLLVEERNSGVARDIAELRVLLEKNHSETVVRLADLDGRLARIESERRIVG